MKSQRVESVVRAAALGLLAAASTACGGSEQSANPDGTSESSSGLLGPAQSPSAGAAGGGSDAEAMATDAAASAEGVTSTRIVADLSLAQFTEMCDEVEGIVEVHASCAGAVSGPGFSYDSDTEAFTDHTCRGFNTCRGFSCVVDA